jgi:diguanylate cyclase (GGDEF)-like protein
LVWLTGFVPLPARGVPWGWMAACAALFAAAVAVNAPTRPDRAPGQRRFTLVLLLLAAIVFATRVPGWGLPPLRYLLFAVMPLYALGSTGMARPGLLLLSVLIPEAARRLIWPDVASSLEATIDLVVFFGVLAAATFGVSAMVARRNRQNERIASEYERLRSSAENLLELGPAAEDRESAPLGSDSRRSHWAGASMKLDRRIESVMKLVASTLQADHVAFFLRDRDGEGMAMRGIVPPAEEERGVVRLPLSGKLIGSVVRTGEPVILGRLKSGDIGYLPRGTRVRSLAIAPVSPFGPVMGLLVADAVRDDAFTGRIDALTGFAGEIADIFLTLHQTRRTEEDGRHKDVLILVSNALASAPLREIEIVGTLLDETAALIGHHRSAFLSVDADGTATLLAARGIDGAKPGSEHPLKKCLLGYLHLHRQPLLFDDLEDGQQRIAILPGLPLRCRSLLAVPLVTDDRLSGIYLAADDEPRCFSRALLDLMVVLANQTAAQLANTALHQRMERMAVTDGLTGLYNHRHFHECLEHELARARRTGEPLSLIILDIDHFKKVNDTHGHPFGDVVLKGVAAQMKGLAREIDVVARYGGEEMAVLLIDTARSGAESFAKRLMEGLRRKRYPNGNVEVRVTASLGGATFPMDASTGADLVHAADQALYHSKKTGRDRYTAAGSHSDAGNQA